LGEGPVWSARQDALWFVDIKGRRLHRYDPATGDGRSWTAPDQPGFALPAGDGGLVAGLPGRLARFDPAAGTFTPLLTLAGEPPGNRLNDAMVDPSGTLWFGSMDDGEQRPTGALYRLGGDGVPARMEAGIVITNGPAVSPDGRTFYHTDTLERTVFAYALSPEGTLHHRRPLIRIDDGAGWPDGTVVDAEGCLWIGLFAGWSARRYTPDGRLVASIRFPCANVTKLAFGGRDRRTLYATTAWKGLTPAERARQPLAGGLFALASDVPGLAPTEFAHG